MLEDSSVFRAVTDKFDDGGIDPDNYRETKLSWKKGVIRELCSFF